MNGKFRIVLTAMIVVVLIAIYVAGIFLFWDIFNVEGALDDLLDTDLYSTEYSPDSATTVNVTFDGKEITAAEETFIREFFVYYYAGLGAMKPENMVRFYTVQCPYELFDELAYRYETYLAAKCPADLSFDECDIAVKIRRRHSVPKTKDFEIDAEISAQIKYHGVTAQIRGVTHSFVLDESGKAPLIGKHTTDSTVHVAADNGLDKVLTANGLSRSDLAYTFFPKYTQAALEMLKQEADELKLAPANTSYYPQVEYLYDRDAAANAAIKGFASDSGFGEYDENDANFVSRCIFESGIPMDSQGDRYDQWKWYDSEVNTERKKTGCSESWFDRSRFYRYVVENSGFGLSGCVTSKGGGELGDVVQIMRGDEPVEEFMITGVIADSDGKVLDYLVSNDRYASVSLLTLGFTDFRVLHIAGYNTANL